MANKSSHKQADKKIFPVKYEHLSDICDSDLHFRDRRGTVSLRHRNHRNHVVLLCQQKHYPV